MSGCFFCVITMNKQQRIVIGILFVHNNSFVRSHRYCHIYIYPHMYVHSTHTVTYKAASGVSLQPSASASVKAAVLEHLINTQVRRMKIDVNNVPMHDEIRK